MDVNGAKIIHLRREDVKFHMVTTEQEVEVYDEYFNIYDIANSMRRKIEKGWRVHTCLKSSGKTLVVYEKELKSWN